MRRNTQHPRATHSRHPMMKPTPFVLGKAHPSPRSRCPCLVPHALYQPNEERMKSDRGILVGFHPCELECRFASRNVWVEANSGQSTFCRAAKWNVNEIHGTQRTKLVLESCRSCCVVPVVARSLNGTPPQRSWTGSFPGFASNRPDLFSL
jgi:hypothetical protein